MLWYDKVFLKFLSLTEEKKKNRNRLRAKLRPEMKSALDSSSLRYSLVKENPIF